MSNVENVIKNIDSIIDQSNVNLTSSFKYFIKENLIKSSSKKISFAINAEDLNIKVIPVIKVIESYSSVETLIKVEIFNDSVIKFSSINSKVFGDILFASKESFNFDNDYFTFVISSDKFLKFLSLINNGKIFITVDLSINTLTLTYNTLEVNLEIKNNDDFTNYERTLNSFSIISEYLKTHKLKQSLDFTNMIFSKHDEINKSKEIHANNDLIFSNSSYIGCSACKFDSFGTIDYVINSDNIKIISSIIPLFDSEFTKVYTTDRSLLLKDSHILFGLPIPKASIKELKDKVNSLSFDKANIFSVQLNRKNLIQSLTALSIFLKDLQEDLVSFTFLNNMLKISVKDLVTDRESFDTFIINYTGSEISIKLKFDTILKNLKYFINRELVDIEILKLNENVQGIRIKEDHLGCSFISFLLDNSF